MEQRVEIQERRAVGQTTKGEFDVRVPCRRSKEDA
jgi:hypothetical protein